MSIPRSGRFYAMCAKLPPGHWHCKHGHLSDCPAVSARECPRVGDEGPLAIAVRAGRMCWLFTSESLAHSLVRVLGDGGAEIRYRVGLTRDDVSKLLADLPAGVTVEDRR